MTDAKATIQDSTCWILADNPRCNATQCKSSRRTCHISRRYKTVEFSCLELSCIGQCDRGSSWIHDSPGMAMMQSALRPLGHYSHGTRKQLSCSTSQSHLCSQNQWSSKSQLAQRKAPTGKVGNLPPRLPTSTSGSEIKEEVCQLPTFHRGSTLGHYTTSRQNPEANTTHCHWACSQCTAASAGPLSLSVPPPSGPFHRFSHSFQPEMHWLYYKCVCLYVCMYIIM